MGPYLILREEDIGTKGRGRGRQGGRRGREGKGGKGGREGRGGDPVYIFKFSLE